MKENSLINSIAAFLISVLSGLGIGSGGLLVAYLSATNQGGADVRAANLFFFILCALAATLMNTKSRTFFPTLILTISVFGTLGCVCGVRLSSLASPQQVKKIFGGMLIISGIYAFVSGIIVKSHKKTAQN